LSKKKKQEKKEAERERKRNKILFWIAIIGFIGSLLAWLYSYRIDNLKEKHSVEITELNTKISSIKRNIGNNDYFDVKELFISKNEKSLPNSSYIMNGNFYVDTTSSKWTYKQISPVKLISKELEINPIELQLFRKKSFTLDSIFKNPEFKNYKRKYKIHNFKYKDSLKIEIEGKSKNLNSSINVVVIKKELAKSIFEIIDKNIKKEKILISVLDIDTLIVNQVIKTAEKQFNKNSSSLIFNFILNEMVYGSLMEGNILELESVQKESEVFYAKYSREFDYKPKKVFETGEVFFC
tara:strand:+ start:1132 stop:2016 length:885 start_codon:yes stop_codon:yes gene_type:complete